MISLGFFFQQKKLSLQAQETEAHSAFLRVIELMRSARQTDNIEGIQLCGLICSRYASPTIVNSAFMRLAEAFRTGSNTLQLEILRVVQRNTENLRKIHSHAEFIRPIFTVMYSNDPVSRAITLRILAAIAVSIPDQLEVHHAVRMALQSTNRSELEAALHACKSLTKVAPKFAEEVAADVVQLMGKPGLSDDEKIAVLQIVPHIASSTMDINMVSSVVSRLLPEDFSGQSSRLVETCVCTISDLVKRSSNMSATSTHLDLLLTCIHNERPEIALPAAAEFQRFFSFCASRVAADVTLGVVHRLLESENPFTIVQGIKCAYIFVNDLLADRAAFLTDGRTIRKLMQHATVWGNTAGACSFSILCTVAGSREASEVKRAEATPATTSVPALSELCQSLSASLKVIRLAFQKKPSVRVLQFIFSGLTYKNRAALPAEALKDSLDIIVGFSVGLSDFPEDAQLEFLAFIRDLCKDNPGNALVLLEKCFPEPHLLQEVQSRLHSVMLLWTTIKIQAAEYFRMQVDESALSQRITGSADVSFCDMYRLARTAAADGRHRLAVDILDCLLKQPELSAFLYSRNWLSFFRGFIHCENMRTGIVSTGSSIDGLAETVNSCVVLQMELQLKYLNEFRTLSRHGSFKKLYMDLRLNVMRLLLQFVESLEKLRVAGSYTKDIAAFELLTSSHLRGCLVKFREVAEESAKLYRSAFDADGPTLGIIRLNFCICAAFGRILSLLTSEVFELEHTVPSDIFPVVRGTAEAFEKLEELAASDIARLTTEDLYEFLKELFRLGRFFLSYAMPIPRYFLQQFQQTTLSVSSTPAPNPEGDFAQVVNMDTKFTLKVDGVLNVDKKETCDFLRRVKLIRVTVRMRLLKSSPFSAKVLHSSETAPETMVHTASMEESNFFSHSFVIFLGYPGNYRVLVVFDMIDFDGVAWSSGQTIDLLAKVLEGSAKRRHNEVMGNRD